MQKKKDSILTKMLLVTLPSTVLGFLLVASICLVNVRADKIKYSSEILKQSNLQVSNMVHKWSSEVLYSFKAVKNTLESIKFDNDAEELKYLETTVNLHEACPYGLYCGDASGVYLDGSGWVPDADYVPSERDWYKTGINNDEFVFGMPYEDAQTGEMIVSASAELKRPDRNKMVISADVFLSKITQAIAENKVLNFKTGYSFLIDKENKMVLAHTDEKLNGYAIKKNDKNAFLQKAFQLIDSKDNEILKINDKGKDYLVTKLGIDGTNWVMYTVIEEYEAMSEYRKTLLQLATLIVIINILISLGFIKALSKITKPIKNMTDDFSKITEGNFTIEVNAPKTKDEIGHMSVAMAGYIDKMKNVIADINSVAMALEDNADKGRSTAGILSKTVTKQNSSMANMQKAIDNLNRSMDMLSKGANELQIMVTDTQSASKEASARMNETSSITDKGYHDMINVRHRMSGINSDMNAMVSVVQDVELSTKEIREIMGVIQDMAEQTNLLSLNASIEAARAGDAGRGFSIVAEEIGRLADVSNEAADNVNKLVEKIRRQVDVMINKTNVSMQNIQDNSAVIEEACTTFENIENNVKITSDAVSEIVSKVNTVEKVSTDMIDVTKVQSDNVQIMFDSIDSLSEDVKMFMTESKDVEDNSQNTSESAKILVNHMKFFNI